MEVRDRCSTFISNQEVVETLLAAKAEMSEGERHKGHHQTIMYETLRYLRGTPARSQTDKTVKECITSLKPFKLTSAEVLQILNHRPTTDVELRMIVEECDERFGDQEVDDMLRIIGEKLPEWQTDSDELESVRSK